jgi:hypothetical protein
MAVQNVAHWVNLAQTYGKPDAGILVVGSKSDIKRVDVDQLAGALASVETSALYDNIDI